MPGTCTATGEWAMAGCGGRAPPAAPLSRPPCSWAAAAGPGRTKRWGGGCSAGRAPSFPPPRPALPAAAPARRRLTSRSRGWGRAARRGRRGAGEGGGGGVSLAPLSHARRAPSSGPAGWRRSPCPCSPPRSRRGGERLLGGPPGEARGVAALSTAGAGLRSPCRAQARGGGGGGCCCAAAAAASSVSAPASTGRSHRQPHGPRPQLPPPPRPPRAGRAGTGARREERAAAPPQRRRPHLSAGLGRGRPRRCVAPWAPAGRCRAGLSPSGAVTGSCPPTQTVTAPVPPDTRPQPLVPPDAPSPPRLLPPPPAPAPQTRLGASNGSGYFMGFICFRDTKRWCLLSGQVRGGCGGLAPGLAWLVSLPPREDVSYPGQLSSRPACCRALPAHTSVPHHLRLPRWAGLPPMFCRGLGRRK